MTKKESLDETRWIGNTKSSVGTYYVTRYNNYVVTVVTSTVTSSFTKIRSAFIVTGI